MSIVIVSEVIGGLGNQMFQYAAGRALSLNKEVRLGLNVNLFDGYNLHQGFELQRIFKGEFYIASKSEIYESLGYPLPSFFRWFTPSIILPKLNHRGLIVEPHFNYWKDIHQVPSKAYLRGYWQTDKYFEKFSDVLRDDFTFKLPLTLFNSRVLDSIEKVNAVSLHVRRGDYVENSTTNSVHGVCSLQYYKMAIECIARKVENPTFFIFSDDMSWVKNNLIMNFDCHYIEHNRGVDSYNDMRLMSLCDHHIIANSSFSWWGAWLNPNPDKIVVAPQKWFAPEKLERCDISDLFPRGWIVL